MTRSQMCSTSSIPIGKSRARFLFHRQIGAGQTETRHRTVRQRHRRITGRGVDLGMQLCAGVNAQGTRTTRTIPAGTIGNAQALTITNERWVSPDLQTVVMSKRTDPRTGSASFQLTNIVKQEPDPTLFQVPSDYTVQDSRGGGGRRGGPRPPARREWVGSAAAKLSLPP